MLVHPWTPTIIPANAILAHVGICAGPVPQRSSVFLELIQRGPMCFPQGATVVDFAYHVHTDVGNQMKEAKVNGKVVAPDYALKNAEVRPQTLKC